MVATVREEYRGLSREGLLQKVYDLGASYESSKNEGGVYRDGMSGCKRRT